MAGGAGYALQFHDHSVMMTGFNVSQSANSIGFTQHGLVYDQSPIISPVRWALPVSRTFSVSRRRDQLWVRRALNFV